MALVPETHELCDQYQILACSNYCDTLMVIKLLPLSWAFRRYSFRRLLLCI